MSQMKIGIKTFNVNMNVKSTGIEFEIRSPDGNQQLGDCYLTMTGLVWRKGKTKKKNGVMISWSDFIEVMTTDKRRKAAVRAAKQA